MRWTTDACGNPNFVNHGGLGWVPVNQRPAAALGQVMDCGTLWMNFAGAMKAIQKTLMVHSQADTINALDTWISVKRFTFDDFVDKRLIKSMVSHLQQKYGPGGVTGTSLVQCAMAHPPAFVPITL